MKVLVTGGAGFIGSHVCDEFLKHGHEVLALDDLSSGRKENLDPRVRLFPLDIRSSEAASLIAREKPQVVAHLAAQMDVRRSVDDPRFDAECNVLGMLNLLEACRKAEVKKFLFSSTGGAIYGEQDTFPATESHPTRPVSPYGVSKASGELYLGYYRAQYGLPYVALRYANVYGPRQNPPRRGRGGGHLRRAPGDRARPAPSTATAGRRGTSSSAPRSPAPTTWPSRAISWAR